MSKRRGRFGLLVSSYLCEKEKQHREQSLQKTLFLPWDQYLQHDLVCCTPQSHQSPQQAGYKLLSNRSCLYLPVVSVLEELVPCYSGFFFPSTSKSV